MAADNFAQHERRFYDDGWMLVRLSNPAAILEARDKLVAELRRLTGRHEVTLEGYHHVVDDENNHTELQLALATFFRANHFGREIIASNIKFFKALMGPDLNVQRDPYLRIARPGKPQDNLDYHRDTFYGASPFELSVVVPFVNLSQESTLSVLSGSPVLPDADFPTARIANPDPNITKGSPKHSLGFPYAPKKMDPASLGGIHPVPVALGEVLIFSLSTVHGSVENRGSHTRWSSDIRVLNSLAPVDLSMRPDYYEVLCRSAVTDRAYTYIKANEARGTPARSTGEVN